MNQRDRLPEALEIRRIGPLLGYLAVLTLLLAGCGEATVSAVEAEDAIRAQLRQVLDVDPGNVECPEDVPVKDGKRFRCETLGDDGLIVMLKVVNQQADLEIVDLSAKKR